MDIREYTPVIARHEVPKQSSSYHVTGWIASLRRSQRQTSVIARHEVPKQSSSYHVTGWIASLKRSQRQIAIIFLLSICNIALANAPLRYDGVLLPQNMIPIPIPDKAYKMQAHRKVGEVVQKGDLIVEWSSPDLLHQQFQAKQETLDCEEMLNQLQHWESSDSMLKAKQDLEEAKLLLSEAKERLSQTHRLYEAGIVSKDEMKTDERHVRQATRNFYQSKMQFDQTKQKNQPANLRLAKMKLATAKERFDLLSDQIKALKFRAPMRGVLIEPLENPSEYYAMIIDPSCWQVSLYVNEWDASVLKVDQKAKISLPTWADQALEGHIQRIHMVPKDLKDRQQPPRYEVKIAIDTPLEAPQSPIRIGMSANVICQS
jgi:multidrug resistance efflux pump